MAEDIAKYNLVALPVVDDNKRLLGIVTVDDALDVLEDEHAEDLRIAGATTSDSDDHRSLEGLVWLMRNEAWFFFWMVGAAALVTLFSPTLGAANALLLTTALPVAVIAANDAASYATSSFLEYDPDDEDTPSTLGFVLKGLGLGIVFSALVGLVGMALVTNVLGNTVGAFAATSRGVSAAVVSILISFASIPVYLTVLRKRDEKNLETSGMTLSLVSMVIALVVFAAVCCVLMGVWGA